MWSLKKDIKKLQEFSDNPYDATYRPEKEMKRLYIGLMVTLPIFLGFCYGFGVLIAGPIFIYWIVFYARWYEYWKDLGWKKKWYFIPMLVMTFVGLILCATNSMFTLLGWFFRNVLGFN